MATATSNHVTFMGDTYERLALILLTRLSLENGCEREMDSLVHELADHPTPAFLENLLWVVKQIVQQWQAEFDWVKSVREEELKVGVENAH